MNEKQVDFLTPAALAGLLVGAVSSIPFFNCLCCLWVVAGAAFSVYLLTKRSEFPVKSNEALLTGLLTGIVGSLVNSLLEIPLRPIYINLFGRFFESMSRFMEEIPPGWEKLTRMQYEGFNLSLFLLDLLLSSILFAFFGAIGGLFGYSLFGKKNTAGEKDVQAPPQDNSHSQPGL